MTTLWLHVGLPKTGTSALQVYFARNADAFRRQGSSYPWGEDAIEGRITPGNGYLLARRGLRGPQAAHLLGGLKNGRGAVLSSEYFAVSTDEHLRQFKDAAEEAKILVYLREQGDMILAHWRYRLSVVNDTRSFDDYATEYLARKYVQFDRYLSCMKDIFGRENLQIRSYKQVRGDLGLDAVIAMGFDPAEFSPATETVNPTPPTHINVGRTIDRVREYCREGNERAVEEWFPGQTVAEVFDFPVL
jgi:hypothetical protein